MQMRKRLVTLGQQTGRERTKGNPRTSSDVVLHSSQSAVVVAECDGEGYDGAVGVGDIRHGDD